MEHDSAAERLAREEYAERVRHAFRSDPEFLRSSQEDERAGRYVSLNEALRQHPPAD